MTADSPNDKTRKERLSRLDRIFAPSPIYFVTSCSFERKPILAAREVHETFEGFISRADQHGAYVGAFVIMPDHLHLFVALAQDQNLSAWMKSLKNAISKALRKSGVSPPHWQKGFFDHVLRSDESYAQKWEYVRENPVRAGLVERSAVWPYAGELWRLEYRN